MGGPASSFFWCVGLDPILAVLQKEARAITPTYVDDIAGMVWGPAHMFLLQLLLVALSHQLGLRTDTHTCCDLWAPNYEEVARLLRTFPVRVARVRGPAGGTAPQAQD